METEYDFEQVEIKPFYKDIDKMILILKILGVIYFGYKVIKKDK